MLIVLGFFTEVGVLVLLQLFLGDLLWTPGIATIGFTLWHGLVLFWRKGNNV